MHEYTVTYLQLTKKATLLLKNKTKQFLRSALKRSNNVQVKNMHVTLPDSPTQTTETY